MAEQKDRDFGEEIKINKYRLDVECERHASLFHYYSNQLAESKAEADRYEDRLKLQLADVEKEVREKAVAKNLKMTDAGVKAEVEGNEVVQETKKKLRDINRRTYILDAAVKSLDHRKSELDNLVKLWLGGYYATPTGGKHEGNDDAIQRENRKNLNRTKKGDTD